MEPKEHERMG